MQRLTTRREDGRIETKEMSYSEIHMDYVLSARINDYYDMRLADYEDTGLAPEEVTELKAQLEQEREKRKRSEVENTKLREVARAAGQIQYMVEHYIRCCGGSTNIDIAEEYKQAFIAAGYGGED